MAELRKRGLTTAVIYSGPVLKLGKAQARTFGVPELPMLEITHPLGGISIEAVEGRSVELLTAALQQAAQGKPEPVVIISADAATPHQFGFDDDERELEHVEHIAPRAHAGFEAHRISQHQLRAAHRLSLGKPEQRGEHGRTGVQHHAARGDRDPPAQRRDVGFGGPQSPCDHHARAHGA